jgi:2-phospho-L-lactate guanylyltransferase
LKIFAIVPVKQFESGKSRLASLFTIDERAELSELLLDNTLNALTKTSALSKVIIVSSDERAEQIVKTYGAKFLKEEKDNGVNNAIAFADNYSSKAGADATIVIPQDLPLLLPEDIDMICGYAEQHEKSLIICPSVRYDGSNALLRRPSLLINTYFDNDSYHMHLKTAIEAGANITVFLSYRIMRDIDTVEDVKNIIEYSSSKNVNNAIAYLRARVK